MRTLNSLRLLIPAPHWRHLWQRKMWQCSKQCKTANLTLFLILHTWGPKLRGLLYKNVSFSKCESMEQQSQYYLEFYLKCKLHSQTPKPPPNQKFWVWELNRAPRNSKPSLILRPALSCREKSFSPELFQIDHTWVGIRTTFSFCDPTQGT